MRRVWGWIAEQSTDLVVAGAYTALVAIGGAAIWREPLLGVPVVFVLSFVMVHAGILRSGITSDLPPTPR